MAAINDDFRALIILGRSFLRTSKDTLDYDRMTATLRYKSEFIEIPLSRDQEPEVRENGFVLSGMEVDFDPIVDLSWGVTTCDATGGMTVGETETEKGFKKWMLENHNYAADQFPRDDGGWSSTPFIYMETHEEIKARQRNWVEILWKEGGPEKKFRVWTIEELEADTCAMEESLRKLKMEEAREIVEVEEETTVVHAFDASRTLAGSLGFPWLKEPERPSKLSRKIGEVTDVYKLYNFVRKLTRDELSRNAITGELLESETGCL